MSGPARDRSTLAWGEHTDISATCPELRLPFFAGKGPYPGCFWSVPMVGGNAVGRTVGVAMAKCFQRLLGAPDRPTSGSEYLPLIVLGMMYRMEQAERRSAVAVDSLRGQIIGFLYEIGKGAQRDAGDLRLQLLYRSTEAELIAPAIVALSGASAAKPVRAKSSKAGAK